MKLKATTCSGLLLILRMSIYLTFPNPWTLLIQVSKQSIAIFLIIITHFLH